MKRAGAPVALVALVALVLLLAGCGASAGTQQITVGAARTFRLAQFTPRTLRAGKPEQLSFTIEQPSGAPLTTYRTGPGPHTGVHLIIVRSDLGAIVHKHPPIGADGRITEEVALPTPGRYRVVIDVYPRLSGPLRNFQLFRWITAAGKAGSFTLTNGNLTSADGMTLSLTTITTANLIDTPTCCLVVPFPATIPDN